MVHHHAEKYPTRPIDRIEKLPLTKSIECEAPDGDGEIVVHGFEPPDLEIERPLGGDHPLHVELAVRVEAPLRIRQASTQAAQQAIIIGRGVEGRVVLRARPAIAKSVEIVKRPGRREAQKWKPDDSRIGAERLAQRIVLDILDILQQQKITFGYLRARWFERRLRQVEKTVEALNSRLHGFALKDRVQQFRLAVADKADPDLPDRSVVLSRSRNGTQSAVDSGFEFRGGNQWRGAPSFPSQKPPCAAARQPKLEIRVLS